VRVTIEAPLDHARAFAAGAPAVGALKR